ncbi:MAG: NAD(P)/FAD-dependent oxidoreductase [Roseicyclus sp.]
MSFPFRLAAPPEHAGPLPEAADLVVIGGGVVGVATALFAARKGLSVVLLEKGRIAAEQSSRNWGWIRVQGRDLAEIPIVQEAQDHWRALDAEAGGRMGVRQVGVTYLARTAADMARYSDWLGRAEPFGVSSRLLGRAETQALLGAPKANWIGALHTPTDLVAEPWVAVPELARLARAEGVHILEHHAARTLDIAGGRVAGLATEAGRIRAPQVVLAGGAWSSLFLRRHGVRIPQLSVRSTALATGPLPQRPATAGVDDAFAFRPRADGGFTLAPAAASDLHIGPDAFRHFAAYARTAWEAIRDVRFRAAAPRGYPDAWSTPRWWTSTEVTPFERMRILDPPPARDRTSETRRRFAQAFPHAAPVPEACAWAGMIDLMPDLVPVIDRVPQIPGLTVATGMSGHGFGIGPGVGRVVADLVTGDDPGHDLGRFRIDRFRTGRLARGPHL